MKQTLIFVVGATAVGKSHFAFDKAKQWGTHIFNGDSVQAYDCVHVGTAKPTEEERGEVPHHLYDIVPPQEELTASKYRHYALKAFEECEVKKPLFVVGGSGFYLQALEKGMFPVAEAPEALTEKWRKFCKENPKQAYELLQNKDPQYAQKISQNDLYRIQRALVLMELENKTVTEIHKKFRENQEPLDYGILKIGFQLPKEILELKIRERVKNMLKNHLIEETEDLLQRGFERWAPLKSIGYKEVVSFLKGHLPLEDLEPAIVQNTMKLAKKQRVWFGKDKEISWFSGDSQGFEEAGAFLSSEFEGVL